MTDIDTLKSLRERVLAASGPDAAMDAEFATDLFGWTACERVYGTGFKDEKGVLRTWYDLPKFTSSIDAALALVDRMLPRWRVALDIKGKPEAPVAWVDNGAGGPSMPSIANTPALAILAAMLSALVAQGEAP